MKNPPKIWSFPAIVLCGIIITPFASPVLQLLNYRSAGGKKEFIQSALWVFGMLVCVVAFAYIPLAVSANVRMALAQLLALVLVVAWFFLFGRGFAARIKPEELQLAVYRSPLSAVFISLGVMAVAHYLIGFLVRFLRHV